MDPEYDDHDWRWIHVPANWAAEGVAHEGRAWYRTMFATSTPASGTHHYLVFRGVDYYADVWLNGLYLGSHEGYFDWFGFDITGVQNNSTNVLAVMVDSPTDVVLMDKLGHRQKSLIKGALQDWDANNLEVNTGGIYEDVILRTTGPIRIDRVRVDYQVGEGRAQTTITLTIEVVNLLRQYQTADIAILITPNNFTGDSAQKEISWKLKPGRSAREIELTLKHPQLWWTWDLGFPHLYIASVTISSAGVVFDTHNVTFGIRTIRKARRGWGLFINGRRIFLRGTNYLSDQLLSRADAARYDHDIALMRDANLNTVRTFCNVERKHFYDACDRNGLLVYQDFPMQWEMVNTSDLVRRAVIQARSMIHQLYNHPSIFLWCFGSEPGRRNFEKVGMALAREASGEDGQRIIHQANAFPENWDYEEWEDRFDWSIDNHLYYGWYPRSYWPTLWHLERERRSHIALVSEYGAQALPAVESLRQFIPSEDLWPMRMKRYNFHGFQDKEQFNWIAKTETLEELVLSSQVYQALVLKYHTEFYRRHKYRPCNGAIQFMFRDCWPAITWSVIDYYGTRKLGFEALQKAFRPVHVIMDWPLEAIVGRSMRQRVFIVNDLVPPLRDIIVEWNISTTAAQVGQGAFLADTIPGNSLTQVGAIECTPPDPLAGSSLVFNLAMKSEGIPMSENVYSVTITAEGDQRTLQGSRAEVRQTLLR